MEEAQKNEVFRQAAEKVAAGWTQGKYRDILYDGKMKYCFLGAIRFTIEEMGFAHPIYRADDLLIERGVDPDGVVNWNDAEGRTQEEVVERLLELGQVK